MCLAGITQSKGIATMTAFRISVGSALKILFTGLVVTSTFTTSLQARQNLRIDRHVVLSVRPNVSHHIEGHRRVPGAAASAPSAISAAQAKANAASTTWPGDMILD
jgi:hypothetical protein